VPERQVAIATAVNVPNLGYPFAQRMIRTLMPEVAGLTVPQRPQPSRDVTVETERLLGTYEMTTQRFTVSPSVGGGVSISGHVTMPAETEIASSPLIPLTSTSFLPTDPLIDGRRGWALAFVGAEDGPAKHLLNGVFALRRIA
jgi:hypothetical protein